MIETETLVTSNAVEESIAQASESKPNREANQEGWVRLSHDYLFGPLGESDFRVWGDR